MSNSRSFKHSGQINITTAVDTVFGQDVILGGELSGSERRLMIGVPSDFNMRRAGFSKGAYRPVDEADIPPPAGDKSHTFYYVDPRTVLNLATRTRSRD